MATSNDLIRRRQSFELNLAVTQEPSVRGWQVRPLIVEAELPMIPARIAVMSTTRVPTNQVIWTEIDVRNGDDHSILAGERAFSTNIGFRAKVPHIIYQLDRKVDRRSQHAKTEIHQGLAVYFRNVDNTPQGLEAGRPVVVAVTRLWLEMWWVPRTR